MNELSIVLFLALISGAFYHFYKRQRWQIELQLSSRENSEALEKEVGTHRTRAENLLNALQDALLTVSPDGQILFANQKANALFGNRTLTNRGLEEAILEANLINPIRKCLDKKKENLDTLIKLPAGSLPSTNGGHDTESHWLLQANIVSCEADDPYYLVIIRDVSSTIHSDQIRKDFVANASHELRTPLAIIRGYLENFIEDDLLDEPDSARHVLGIMDKHVTRINQIVEDMLVISKLESGEASALNIAPFHISSCINDVLERLEPLIKKQEAQVKVTLSEPDLSIEGDRFYWTQVLFNLIENALKQNSTIAVKVKVKAEKMSEGKLQLNICDNGVGIPRADLPKIFKRFFRVEKHHSQGEIKGTGLGLSIVKRAVEAHGGKITATSTPGVETCFSMEVPLKQQEQSN